MSLSLRTLGLIFVASGDPGFNTSRPTGELADSGWQWQGNWRGFGGTPIAPNLFLTAKHVGGTVGDLFSFSGQIYPTLANYPDPASDLIIWKVCGGFPTFAPLYAETGERGAPCVVHGHGLLRGAEVSVAAGEHPGLRGWSWGNTDGRLRWGENRINAVLPGQPGLGEQLEATFDAGAGPNEAMLAGGDSGSGVFIRDEAGWALAGVNFAVDGPFRIVGAGPPFSAALFDKRGVFEWNGNGKWSLVPDDDSTVPAKWYATRVSARLDWIRGIIAAEAQPESSPVVEAAAVAAGPYSIIEPVAADAAQHWLVLPLPTANQFLRLRHCRAVVITSVTQQPAGLELRWR
jgi:hypothetical protein